MHGPTPPLTWLRAFEASARHLSFTRAADELGLTQSAVSQHVRALEAHLGQQLFRRAHRQLHLSEAGRLLLPDVTAGLALLTQASQRFRQAGPTASLRIATSASVARFILAPGLADFRARSPDVIIELQTTVWPDDFASSAADIEIRFGRAEMVGHGAQLLEPSHLHIVATPQLARAWKQNKSSVPLIQPIGISTDWQDLIPDMRAHLLVDTHGMAVDLALEGAGIALTHSQISRPAILSGHLQDLDWPTRIAAQEGYYLAVKPGTDPALTTPFKSWLLDRVASLWGAGPASGHPRKGAR